MKKIIDEKGRLFGKISVIDIFVIIVAAVLVFAVYTKTGSGDTPAASVNTIPVTYSVFVNAVRDTTVSLLRPGDKLYTENGIYVGTIKSVDVDDAKKPLVLTDGTYVNAPVDERFDVTLIVEAQCSEAGGRYYADRAFELNTSAEHKLVTKYNAITGNIINITAGVS